MFLRRKDRTPSYENAVAALHKLAEEDPDLMDRAFAEVQSDITKKWMTKGLRRSSGSQSHLRLLGKNPRLGKSYPDEKLPFLADHTDLWLKGGQPFLWTTQPYSLDSRGIKELAGLIDLGLDAAISASRSWHFPGSTVMVELEKRKDRVRPAGQRASAPHDQGPAHHSRGEDLS